MVFFFVPISNYLAFFDFLLSNLLSIKLGILVQSSKIINMTFHIVQHFFMEFSMQAVILAGGFGTRLSHIVTNVPKPMAPIDDVPFLDYLYHQLKLNGCDDFLFLTGYKSESIEAYFSNFPDANFLKEETPLGTGGALLNALHQDLLQDEFLLVNGDTFFSADFSLLKKYHKKDTVTMALRFSEDIARYGLVAIDQEMNEDHTSAYKVLSFSEKGQLSSNQIDGYINAGTYLISKSILEEQSLKLLGNTPKNNLLKGPISLENIVLPDLAQNEKLYGLPLGGSFIDIGIPEDYHRAQSFIPDAIKKTQRPAVFVDKDGTLIEDPGYVHGPNVTIIPSVIEYIKKEFLAKGYYLILATNQAGIAKNKFLEKDMEDNIKALVENCKNLGVTFDDIEYCSYFDGALNAKYNYKSLCRKPYPGMMLKACEKLNIDMAKSVMIGDKDLVDNIKLPYIKSIIVKNGKIK